MQATRGKHLLAVTLLEELGLTSIRLEPIGEGHSRIMAGLCRHRMPTERGLCNKTGRIVKSSL